VKDTWIYQYFKPYEFVCRCTGLCDHEDMIYRPLVSALDKLRARLGVPLNITSGTRCLRHNRNEGGVSTSQHLVRRTEGMDESCSMAADVRVPDGMTTQEVADIVEEMLDFVDGGVGLYDTFIHLDKRGSRARWDMRTGQQLELGGM
jgi:uncharacterized protein YcbK (DUF882 family)